MKVETIDLYEYFKIERPQGGAGYLTAYIINQSKEFCPNRLRPAMLILPGGGYVFCSDRENEPIAIEFLSKGFNAFALLYSVSPQNNKIRYPYQLIEACMAVAFIRENATKYNISPDHIASVGFSAGGHLCAMLATLYKEKVVKDFLGDKANLCRLDGVVLSYPVISSGEYAHEGSFNALCGDDDELRKYLSLEERVDENSVPAFIWATVDDNAVPSENSMLMAMAYKKAGVPFELHIFESGRHGLSLANEEVIAPNAAVSKWLDLVNNWLNNRGFKIIN